MKVKVTRASKPEKKTYVEIPQGEEIGCVLLTLNKELPVGERNWLNGSWEDREGYVNRYIITVGKDGELEGIEIYDDYIE